MIHLQAHLPIWPVAPGGNASYASKLPICLPPLAASPAPSFSRAVVSDHVELDSIQDGVITDGSRMSRTFTERLPISLTRSTDVIRADRVERDQVDRIDLNVAAADLIDATNSNLWPLPESKGDGDAARGYFGTQLSAELHSSDDNRM